METVTYVLEGKVEHYDNHGHEGTIVAGDAMWMTAGRGVIHNEQPMAGQTVHALQLWINLMREDKQVPAHLQTLHAASLPVRREPGVEARVFSGRSGAVEAPTTNHTPVTMVEFRIGPDAEIQQEIPAGFNAFVAVLEGSGSVCSIFANVKAGQIAWLTQSENESAVFLRGDASGMRALLFAGKPLREPVVARGPFVMNTEEELFAAFSDYRSQGEQFGL
jgi:redox-sensitive bicupin YhaK (pirin superfamily)